MDNYLKRFLIVSIIVVAGIGAIKAQFFSPPSSIVKVYQTGTIHNSQVKAAWKQYDNFGCYEVNVIEIDPGYSNVYCLDVIIGEENE